MRIRIISMNKKFITITGWIAGAGLTLFGMIFGGVKYLAWEQIKEDRARIADSIMIHQLREIKTDLGIFKIDYYTTKSNVSTLQGSYSTLDRSYIRTLEKYLKDKDEKDQYQKEKIQMLEEQLKKN